MMSKKFKRDNKEPQVDSLLLKCEAENVSGVFRMSLSESILGPRREDASCVALMSNKWRVYVSLVPSSSPRLC